MCFGVYLRHGWRHFQDSTGQGFEGIDSFPDDLWSLLRRFPLEGALNNQGL